MCSLKSFATMKVAADDCFLVRPPGLDWRPESVPFRTGDRRPLVFVGLASPCRSTTAAKVGHVAVRVVGR